jgi:hypothetical protein
MTTAASAEDTADRELVITRIFDAPRSLVLRSGHSPNIWWAGGAARWRGDSRNYE